MQFFPFLCVSFLVTFKRNNRRNIVQFASEIPVEIYVCFVMMALYDLQRRIHKTPHEEIEIEYEGNLYVLSLKHSQVMFSGIITRWKYHEDHSFGLSFTGQLCQLLFSSNRRRLFHNPKFECILHSYLGIM